jgi:hypothetical protein
MEQEMMQEAPMEMQAPEEMGRATDTVLGHLSLGEVVIPRAFLDDPQVMEMLQALFEQGGVDMAEFTVGDPANKINPETGYPEFFKLKKLFRAAAPAALAYFAPGIGTALGSALLGTGAAGASTLGSALIGGGIGALGGGGLKGALTGAVTGGIGANIGSLPKALQGPTQSGAPLKGTAGSGILGSVGKATGLTGNKLSSLGGLVGGSGGGGSSFSPLGIAANLYGGSSQDAAIKKQQEQLLNANQSQLANLETFDPSNITNDAGYQFNLEQGQKGLNQGLAAGGSLFSGRALKAASEYNQGYASNAFDAAYQRWLQKTQGKNALIGAGGDVRANATGAKSQNLAQSLSNAIGSPVGAYGQNSQLDLLKRLGLA